MKHLKLFESWILESKIVNYTERIEKQLSTGNWNTKALSDKDIENITIVGEHIRTMGYSTGIPKMNGFTGIQWTLNYPRLLFRDENVRLNLRYLCENDPWAKDLKCYFIFERTYKTTRTNRIIESANVNVVIKAIDKAIDDEKKKEKRDQFGL